MRAILARSLDTSTSTSKLKSVSTWISTIFFAGSSLRFISLFLGGPLFGRLMGAIRSLSRLPGRLVGVARTPSPGQTQTLQLQYGSFYANDIEKKKHIMPGTSCCGCCCFSRNAARVKSQRAQHLAVRLSYLHQQIFSQSRPFRHSCSTIWIRIWKGKNKKRSQVQT